MAAGSLDECVRLLKGSNDEQRLVGLLLATKFVSGDNVEAVRQVFDAVGMQFINRLLKTGRQVQNTSEEKGQQQQAYLQLALTVLASFSRLPELASTDDFIAEVPGLVETMGNRLLSGCTRFNFVTLPEIWKLHLETAVSVCSQYVRDQTKALRLCIKPRHLVWLRTTCMTYLQVAMSLLSFLLQSYSDRAELAARAEELIPLVPSVAKQLGLQQDLRKFEALGLLRTLLTSDFSMPILATLKQQAGSEWASDARSVAEQKQAALELAEAIVELVGNSWLLGPMSLPQEGKQAPRFRFFRIVVEALRVETEVVLHDVAKTLFGTGHAASQSSPESAQKLRALATDYALLEHVVNIISEEAAEGTQLSESLQEKTVTNLNDIIGVVLQLLEGAQEHGLSCGDILLASVRLLGRYLGEAPAAHNHRVLKLLGYLLSVTTEGEERPLHAVSFMLPWLTLMTMDVEGCNAVVSCKAHKQVVGFLQTAVEGIENAPGGIIVGASDVLLNLFVKKGELSARLVPQDFIPVLPAVAAWAGRSSSNMEIALAGAVCLLVLSLTTERETQKNLLSAGVLNSVIKLIARNVEACVHAEDTTESPDEEDLWDITVSGCASCVERYPSLRSAILSIPGIQARLLTRKAANELDITKPALQLLLATLGGTS